MSKMWQNLAKSPFIAETQRTLHKISISKLLYTEYGDPSKVIQKLNEKLEYELGPNDVLVKMLAAPVNPQDVNIIEGKYPVRPSLPSTPGNEGVGEIVQAGTKVMNLEIGDRVVPIKSQIGTWRSHFVSDATNLLKVPKDLGLVESATFSVNPCTAYRLLRDFTALKPGDALIQNGANSACGQNVIQIARVMQIKTINIVRMRERIDDLKKYLKDLGADFVFTEEEVKETRMDAIGMKKPKLGLNCVGGKSCFNLIRHLDKNAVLVTYGGMARQPVSIPTAPLIFKKLKVVGFWLNDWLETSGNLIERQLMYDDIIKLMISGELKSPNHRIIPFDKFKEALTNTLNDRGMVGRKFILKFA